MPNPNWTTILHEDARRRARRNRVQWAVGSVLATAIGLATVALLWFE